MDIRHEMHTRGLRPIKEHRQQLLDLGTKHGVSIELGEKKLPGGTVHGGAMAKGVTVNGEFVPLEVEKNIKPTEARILKKISEANTKHLNIPKIIELTDDKVVMENIPGQLVYNFSVDYKNKYLAGEAGKEKQIELKDLMDLAAKGLSELHSLDIIKGHVMGSEDFESELHGRNFIIGNDGKLYWIDFGAAKEEENSSSHFTDFDEFFGNAFHIYGPGESTRIQLAKAKRAVDAYFEEGSSAKQFLVLEKMAKMREGFPMGELAKEKAKELLSAMPPNVRADFIKESLELQKKHEYVPPEGQMRREDTIKRNAEWRKKWEELLKSVGN